MRWVTVRQLCPLLVFGISHRSSCSLVCMYNHWSFFKHLINHLIIQAASLVVEMQHVESYRYGWRASLVVDVYIKFPIGGKMWKVLLVPGGLYWVFKSICWWGKSEEDGQTASIWQKGYGNSTTLYHCGTQKSISECIVPWTVSQMLCKSRRPFRFRSLSGKNWILKVQWSQAWHWVVEVWKVRPDNLFQSCDWTNGWLD